MAVYENIVPLYADCHACRTDCLECGAGGAAGTRRQCVYFSGVHRRRIVKRSSWNHTASGTNPCDYGGAGSHKAGSVPARSKTEAGISAYRIEERCDLRMEMSEY